MGAAASTKSHNNSSLDDLHAAAGPQLESHYEETTTQSCTVTIQAEPALKSGRCSEHTLYFPDGDSNVIGPTSFWSRHEQEAWRREYAEEQRKEKAERYSRSQKVKGRIMKNRKLSSAEKIYAMMQYDAKDALATCRKWKAETHATGESINARYAALQENRKALRGDSPMNLHTADAAITANRDEQLLQAEEQRKIFMQTVRSGSIIDYAVADAVTAIGDSGVTGGVHKLGSGQGSEKARLAASIEDMVKWGSEA